MFKLAIYLTILSSIVLGESVDLKLKNTKEVRKPRGHAYAYAYDDQHADQYAHVAPSYTLKPAHHGKVGFSVGGGLVSIARGAADQARSQLANQHLAATQAAFQSKNMIAQSASQFAQTAATALAGKQVILSGLEQQSRDAHVAVENEKLQLQQAQRAATATRNAAQQAMHQVQIITAGLNTAQLTLDHATQAAAEAAAELAAQTSMVGQAKARAQSIDEQLAAAQVDFHATQSASDKAAAAAQLAKNNAESANSHVLENSAVPTNIPTVAEEEGDHPVVDASHELIIDNHHEPSAHTVAIPLVQQQPENSYHLHKAPEAVHEHQPYYNDYGYY